MRRRTGALPVVVRFILAALVLVLFSGRSIGAPKNSFDYRIAPTTVQALVGIADDWNSSAVVLQRYERTAGAWHSVGPPWAARIGQAGLAWGRGLHPTPTKGRRKQEGDERAPAGVFALPEAYGFDPQWADKTSLPYIAVGTQDLFISDPQSQDYNRHVRLDHDPATPWELSQQMVQRDPAHALQILVAHNTDPTVPGAGSAIFLHVWRRDGGSATSGCTAMSRRQIETLVGWLKPGAVFVIMPREEYTARQASWRLPAIAPLR